MTTDPHKQIDGTDLGITEQGALVTLDPKSGQRIQVTPPAVDANGLLVDLLSSTTDLNHASISNYASKIGTLKSVSGLTATLVRFNTWWHIRFTFTNVAMSHVDAGASGSSGSVELFDFIAAGFIANASRLNLTLTADNVLDNGTTLALKVGLGTAAAPAGDAALSGTSVNVQGASSTLNASAHVVTTGQLGQGQGSFVDGSSAAVKLYLNESASAATSVANGTITVNGTIDVIGVLLGT